MNKQAVVYCDKGKSFSTENKLKLHAKALMKLKNKV